MIPIWARYGCRTFSSISSAHPVGSGTLATTSTPTAGTSLSTSSASIRRGSKNSRNVASLREISWLRSYLYAPGSRPDLMAKAGLAGADAVIFDLEDSVASGDKERARSAVVEMLDGIRDHA